MNNANNTQADADGLAPPQRALLGALGNILEPLAAICVQQGIPIQALEEVLRQAMVSAAKQGCTQDGATRVTSRISAMTGLTRREVSRIEASAAPARATSRSPSSEVFTRWAHQPNYRNADNQPMELPQAGPAPSFETLAQSVTRDVHPRTLLDEMVRRSLVTVDAQSKCARLNVENWVPKNDWAQMVAFLGDNVGDHLRGAVGNVLGDGSQHLEQSLLGDELSTESVQALKPVIQAHWLRLLDDLVPEIERLGQVDREAGRARDQALRLGMYTWAREMTPTEQAAANPAAEGEK